MRLGPRILLVIWLTVVWCALWGEASVGNLIAGVVIGSCLVLLFHPGADRGGQRNVVAILRFGGYFAWALVVSNVTVAKQVLFPAQTVDLAIVAVPLRVRSPLIVSFVANAITLTPGTMTIEIAPSISEDDEALEARPVVLYVHCLDGSDPEGVRAEGLNLEEMAVRAFGTPADREAVQQPAPSWPPPASRNQGGPTA